MWNRASVSVIGVVVVINSASVLPYSAGIYELYESLYIKKKNHPGDTKIKQTIFPSKIKFYTFTEYKDYTEI